MKSRIIQAILLEILYILFTISFLSSESTIDAMSRIIMILLGIALPINLLSAVHEDSQ